MFIIGKEILDEINMEEFNHRSVKHVRYHDVSMRILFPIDSVRVSVLFTFEGLSIDAIVQNVERSHKGLVASLSDLSLIIFPYTPWDDVQLINCDQQ